MKKKFKITEYRTNGKGEVFVVETLVEGESAAEVRKRISETKPCTIKDKNYKIKEIGDEQ